MHVGRVVSLAWLCPAALLLVGCGAPLRVQPTSTTAPREGVFMEKGAVVLAGSALEDVRGSLLDNLRGKIPSFRMRRGAGDCPSISLRGYAGGQSLVQPDVYVDGTHATDTCILTTLRSEDVQRVEVYPMGFTTRPGYGMHAAGLILVFMASR